MINLSLPAWVSQIIQKPVQIKEYTDKEVALLKQKLARFNCRNPLVSVVIPAWNEEKGILHTLISLANSNTDYETELIVVDNNSSDGTAALLKQLGVKTLVETKQGVGNARTCGLQHAKGKFILTGDSDTLYPPDWISTMISAMLEDEKIYCVHGGYSFLPGANTPRWQYGCYELMSGIFIWKKENAAPFAHVLGLNCGYIRSKGIDVNGYDTKNQRIGGGTAGVSEGNATEDGMMALRLQQAGGKIKAVHDVDARVWTSGRRIQMDGGLVKVLNLRIKKQFVKN